MATFNFYQDQKHTVWDRHRFSVEADDYGKAVEIVHSLKNEPIIENEGNGITFLSCATLYDTMEHLSPEDNGGCSTIEMYYENGVEIASNSE